MLLISTSVSEGLNPFFRIWSKSHFDIPSLVLGLQKKIYMYYNKFTLYYYILLNILKLNAIKHRIILRSKRLLKEKNIK